MSARKRKMIAKARELVDYGSNYSFRQIMNNYRFWKCVMRYKNDDKRIDKIVDRFFDKLNQIKKTASGANTAYG